MNNKGQLGNGTIVSNGAVSKISLEDRVKLVTVGDDFGCVLTRSGRVKCFGDGDKGKLGLSDNKSTNVPTDLGL